MLLSNRMGYLFIEIAETGTSSVRRSLTASDEGLRSWRERLVRSVARVVGYRTDMALHQYAPAIVAQELLPPEQFSRLFKFAFVRNPWDRLVSAWKHLQRERPSNLRDSNVETFPGFANFLLSQPDALQAIRDGETTSSTRLLRSLGRPQLESLIGLHGELIVDYVGRYESIEGDLHQIAAHVSLPEMAFRVRRNGLGDDYRPYYTDELAEMVANRYADDLTAFQYQFDSSGENSQHQSASRESFKAIAGRIHGGEDRKPCEGAVEC